MAVPLVVVLPLAIAGPIQSMSKEDQGTKVFLWLGIIAIWVGYAGLSLRAYWRYRKRVMDPKALANKNENIGEAEIQLD